MPRHVHLHSGRRSGQAQRSAQRAGIVLSAMPMSSTLCSAATSLFSLSFFKFQMSNRLLLEPTHLVEDQQQRQAALVEDAAGLQGGAGKGRLPDSVGRACGSSNYAVPVAACCHHKGLTKYQQSRSHVSVMPMACLQHICHESLGRGAARGVDDISHHRGHGGGAGLGDDCTCSSRAYRLVSLPCPALPVHHPG